VEEEDHARGVEPPAYWPSIDGSVVVEDLTCRYAPQVSLYVTYTARLYANDSSTLYCEA